MHTMTDTPWVVRDDARELHFSGVKLSDVSSRTGAKQRWIELRLYRTVGGNYVVERVGCSKVAGEVSFFFAQTCETPRAVLETLYARDNDGAWFLSNVARDLLSEAGEHDAAVREVYDTEYVE